MTLQNTKKVSVYALAALMLAVAVTASSSAGAQQSSSQAGASALTDGSSQLDARRIYETGSITADPDVKTLVMTIPDNAGIDGSAWRGFLPSNATVASGTMVVMLNADVNATHTITVSGPELVQSAPDGVPYLNIMAYRLDELGQYIFTDEASQINGTINVVENATLTDDSITNESRSAVGLFIAPSSAKSNVQAHLNTLGFNAVSTYNFSSRAQDALVPITASANGDFNNGTGNSDMTLFVWTQQVSHPNTIDGRLASKVRLLEELFYPANATKQINAPLNN